MSITINRSETKNQKHMKKIFAIMAVASVLASFNSYGQGVVAFVNSSGTRVRFSDSAAAAYGTTNGAPLPGGGAFLAGLYYAAGEDPGMDPGDLGMLNTMSPNTGAPFSSLSPGTFNGGNRTTPATTAPGARAWFQVRVWEAAFGSTYEQAFNAPAMSATGGQVRKAIVGIGNRFNMVTGVGTGGSIVSGGFQPFAANVVPEPSIIALAVVGMAGLLVIRRRRS